MARETIILKRNEIADQINVVDTIDAIEQAMGQFELGHDYLPPKAIYELPVGEPAWAACITGFTNAANLLSIKVGQERSYNTERDLPTTNSWIACFEPVTGELLMLCDGMLPTMYRTAAAAAVGTRHLARQDSRVLAVIGVGQLGQQCVRAVHSVRNFQHILIHDAMETMAEQVATQLSAELNTPITVSSAQKACAEADVIVTATNSREAIVAADWVGPGTHMSCMGSDMHEKIECEAELLPRCRIYADQIEHALQRGEVSQAVEKGVLEKTCHVGSLGQVINGSVPGRQNETDITMFDGVGIGIQDTTVVRTIYDQAEQRGLGLRLAFS